ncbi:MotA/TolQ/ExbB proton channel family protein [Azoarcus sp. TTM-91]|uniref:MotA/TolQ/ExbB proton channel family protein n=1 Tax=Azoarcus sp. TTM-91 TaxID=2691581 RepID=UPI00145E8EE5|nr:MotA/TolQ/ExbB proton channel family protein [Azoarcus sp. TTM-91]
MFAIIQAVGWPIWPLLLASVVAVALIIERSISLRRARVVPAGLLDNVLADFRQRGVSPEMVERVSAHSPFGRVLAAGLRNINSSREVMKEAIEESGQAVVHELERFLTTLGTIASISPLLGLFGTIVGMIEIFASQGTSGANPAQLAQGISVALYTTGFGLVIAIPSMIFWRHFRRLIDDFVVDMEQQAVKLVEVAHGDREA